MSDISEGSNINSNLHSSRDQNLVCPYCQKILAIPIGRTMKDEFECISEGEEKWHYSVQVENGDMYLDWHRRGDFMVTNNYFDDHTSIFKGEKEIFFSNGIVDVMKMTENNIKTIVNFG